MRGYVGFVIVALLTIVTLSSCSKRILPESCENVRDTLYVVDSRRDSVYICDSVFSMIVQKGDTVERVREVFRVEVRDRVVTDTVWRVRTEDVVRTERVNVLTRWQRVRIVLFDWLLVGAGVAVAVWWCRRFW